MRNLTPYLPLLPFLASVALPGVAAAQGPALLASTNQGELAAIDLGAAIATLIGVQPAIDTATFGWTDIAFADDGRLFGISRRTSELDLVVHLYEVDPATGLVISEIGVVEETGGGTTFQFLSDISFRGASLYGNYCCGGGLLSIDEATALSSFAANPQFGGFQNGGIVAHPMTGEPSSRPSRPRSASSRSTPTRGSASTRYRWDWAARPRVSGSTPSRFSWTAGSSGRAGATPSLRPGSSTRWTRFRIR